MDGTYEAFSSANSRGYGWARVTIAEDAITEVELKEFTDLAQEKDWETYGWPQAVQANQELPAQFVANNSYEVDIVAEATSSSNKYMEAVKFALEKAKNEPEMQTTYFDGMFMGNSDADERGNWAVVWVTIENDAITEVMLEQTTDVPIEEGSEETEKKFKTPENYTNYPKYFEAQESLQTAFVEAGPGGVADVDAVAEATGSSDLWKQAVADALAKAMIR